MSNLIQPQTLKGFRDSLPEQEIKRRDLMARLEDAFRSFGYEPIDTPALEYEEILLGKGGGETEKQVYRFEDHGGRRVALRYDLTVPFARFTAQHREHLPLPFKRYHMAKVWRGENPQKGRYREFYQCDFDIVGAESPDSDAEIIQLMDRSLRLAGARVRIHLSDRRILVALLNTLGFVGDPTDILRLVDKKDKIDPAEFESGLKQHLSTVGVDRVLNLLAPASSWDEALNRLDALGPEAATIRKRMEDIILRLKLAGIEDVVRPDFSITRGLDYYTGVVFESFLEELPSLGSVCSGGRYDNLAQLYTKERLPGVGASVGLDRLLAGLEEIGRTPGSTTCTQIVVFGPEDGQSITTWDIAQGLRRLGLRVDVFTEVKKPAAQYQYAEKKRIPWVLIPKPDDSLLLKHLKTGNSRTVTNLQEVVDLVNTGNTL